MRYFVTAIAMLAAACGTADVEQDPADPAAVEKSAKSAEPGPTQYGAGRGFDADVEAEFVDFMRQPLLLTMAMPPDGLKVVLRRDIARYQEMSGQLKSAAEANPEITPVAAFRQAQLFTRMGCTIVQTPPPNRLADDQIAVYEGILAEQAQAVLQRVPIALENVPEDDSLREHAARLQAIPGPKAGAQAIKTHCAQLQDYWHDDANVLTVDETEPEHCEQRDAVACWVWAELGSGGEEAMAKACELGAMVACPEEEAAEEPKSKVLGIGGMGE